MNESGRKAPSSLFPIEGVPGQRHKKNAGDLFDGVILRVFGDQNQVLIAERIAEGQYESPTVFELPKQRRRDVVDGRGNHDGVERRLVAPAVVTVSQPGFDRVELKRPQGPRSLLVELCLDFDGVDFAGDG